MTVKLQGLAKQPAHGIEGSHRLWTEVGSPAVGPVCLGLGDSCGLLSSVEHKASGVSARAILGFEAYQSRSGKDRG
jgi:hypothetical protein